MAAGMAGRAPRVDATVSRCSMSGYPSVSKFVGQDGSLGRWVDGADGAMIHERQRPVAKGRARQGWLGGWQHEQVWPAGERVEGSLVCAGGMPARSLGRHSTKILVAPSRRRAETLIPAIVPVA